VGLCESGKTLIFSQLIYKKAVESFTSMKENVGVLQIENKVLRDYLSPVILTNTKCILYL
jgi:signal recognition particle receptor subunit beta